jgi:hypothetical protein
VDKACGLPLEPLSCFNSELTPSIRLQNALAYPGIAKMLIFFPGPIAIKLFAVEIHECLQ